MATISDITNAASYRGDPNLGGAKGVGITIDSTPLQRFAAFKFYRDQNVWEQKQKNNVIAAKQIADMSAYDVNSPFKEYTQDLTKDLTKVRDYFRETKDAIVYNPDNPQPFIEGQKMLGEFKIKRSHATVNDTLYNAALQKINQIQDVESRDAAKELLDINVSDLFENGVADSYNHQLLTEPEVSPEDYDIPSMSFRDKYNIQRSANDMVTYGLKYADLAHAQAQADGVYFGLSKKELQTDTPEFKKLSQKNQRKAILLNQISQKRKTELDNMAAELNGLIGEIKTRSGVENIKVSGIPENEIAKNPTLSNIIADAKLYNDQVDIINAQAKERFSHINLDDGVSPQDLILLETFHKNKNSLLTEIKPGIDQTSNAIEKARIGLGYANLALEQTKWKESQTGGETVKNGAFERAKRIYSDMEKLADQNGVISPDKLRQLNVEQLKYLGIEEPQQRGEAGLIINSGGFKPLNFEKDTDYAIQLVDGNIKVLKGARKLDNGLFGGTWDNTKSTNLLNVATNILNEELKLAGAKELNSYMPIDLGGGGVSSNSTGGSQTKSITTQGKNAVPSKYDKYQVPR